MPVNKWRFEAVGNSSDYYYFEVNPNRCTLPKRSFQLQQKQTVAPDGQVVLMAGRPQLMEMSFGGTARSADEVRDLDSWYQRQVPIVLNDDIYNSYVIIITNFGGERTRNVTTPFKYEWSMDCLVTFHSIPFFA